MERKEKGERNCEQNVLNFSLETRLKTQASGGTMPTHSGKRGVLLMMNC